jgi:RNA polymerase sigma factor (sigma-70 family)
MSCRDSAVDRALSDRAWTEFHRRHMSALYSRCKRICQTAGAPPHFASDLAQATLVKAVERHTTFDDGTQSSSTSKRTQSWLGRIARNLLVDSLRNPHRPGPITGAQDEIPFEDYSDEEFASLLCDGTKFARTAQTIRIVIQALQSMDERTRSVLVQTLLQRKRSPKGSYMYRGSADALAKRFNTTTVNIRRIRMNAIRAVGEYLKRHGGQ